MYFDVADLIRQESASETFANIGEDTTARLDHIIESLEDSYFTVPFNEDALHLIQHEGNYIIPYDDMVKYCKTNYVDTFVEAVPVIAKHYDIDPSNIFIAVQENDTTVDDAKTADRIEAALETGLIVERFGGWYDEDDDFEDLDTYMMYGEASKLITDEDLKNINDPLHKVEMSSKPVIGDDIDFIKVFPDSSFKHEATMVNVYQHGANYYIEISDLNIYMDANDIDSVREAVTSIAEANDIEDPDDITLLVEKCSKSKAKKASKKKECDCGECPECLERKKGKKKNAKLEAVNIIADKHIDSLNLVWLTSDTK